MEAYRIKHKPTNLYYNKYAYQKDMGSNLLRRGKGTICYGEKDNILSCKGDYVKVIMKGQSCFLSLYDKYFSKLERENTKDGNIVFKIPKAEFEIEPYEEEHKTDDEKTKEQEDCTAPTECTNIGAIQALNAKINKLYEELNANIGMGGSYFENKYREITVLTNKLNNLKKCS